MLAETMKKIAKQTNEAGSPATIMFGVVTSASPLTIRVDNRFDITDEAIIVTKEFKAGFCPTHYHTGFAGGPATENAEGHTHALKSNYQTNTDAASEYYYGLKAGEKVVLLRNQGGQQFLVLGRL